MHIQTERVDDIPLLIWQQRVMGIPRIIDDIIQPHGNRDGLSVGWTVAAWLSYIVSQADHRLSYVESWATDHLSTLQGLLPEAVSVSDFTDDRLGDILRYLSDDTDWQAIETEVGQQIIQVYQLPQDRVYTDSTSVSVYHNSEDNPLLAHGHSKDHRPDLPQFKVMLSSLAPFGLPLATLHVAGNQADDGLYTPVIEQSRQVLGRSGLLYIGDSKMEALHTRANLVAGNDFYLMPLSSKHAALLHELLQPILDQTQALTDIYLQPEESDKKRLPVRAYETVRPQEAQVGETTLTWMERVMVVYSPAYAASTRQGLMKRLRRAEEELRTLTPLPGRGQRQWSELDPLVSVAEAILKRYRVQGLFTISYERQETQRHIRKHKERPARTETSVRYQIQVDPDDLAIEQVQETLGWRLYVTNCPSEQLPVTEAVRAYRQAPVFEHNFSRLKNHSLGLRPLYLHRHEHIVGLVRLLSLALRILTLVEFVVQRELQEQNATLIGLYEGNPNRATDRPTTERLLRAFQPITLTQISLAGQRVLHLTPLTPLQTRILALIGLPESTYTDLAGSVHAISP